MQNGHHLITYSVLFLNTIYLSRPRHKKSVNNIIIDNAIIEEMPVTEFSVTSVELVGISNKILQEAPQD